MRIYPLPPGLTARLAIPPTYQTAALETAPPAYIAPHPPVSSERPESILLPPCPSPPSTSPSPPPPTHHQQQQQQEQQQQPPEYSPSVYSQHLSYHLSAAAAAADFGFPSSPRRPPPLFTKNVELEPAHLLPQEPHLARFKESRTDLEMRVDLEGGADVDAESGRERRIGGLGKDLIGERGVGERRSWWGRVRERRRLIGVLLGSSLVLVVLVVVIVVGVCVRG